MPHRTLDFSPWEFEIFIWNLCKGAGYSQNVKTLEDWNNDLVAFCTAAIGPLVVRSSSVSLFTQTR